MNTFIHFCVAKIEDCKSWKHEQNSKNMLATGFWGVFICQKLICSLILIKDLSQQESQSADLRI